VRKQALLNQQHLVPGGVEGNRTEMRNTAVMANVHEFLPGSGAG
jgi:hypothetical protein